MEKHMDSFSLTLMAELQNYEKQGISIWLDGVPSSPGRVTDAHRVQEGFSYMRDYVFDEEELTEIHFDRIDRS